MYYNPYYPAPMPDNLAQLRQNNLIQQQPMMQAPTQPSAQTSSGIIWVQGVEAAKSYMTAPGSSVLLMDSEGSRFYIKSTDQSGMPLPLRIFDFQERAVNAPQPPTVAAQASTEEYVTRGEFEHLAALVGAMQGETEKEEKKHGK